MVIHNEIFCTYRIEQEKIKEAIELLKENGYIIYKKEETI
jgi:transcription initiation factor IIE alpha subunit